MATQWDATLRLPAGVRPGEGVSFAGAHLQPAQQARLVALAPELASVSLSLNSSAIYLGSVTGAAVGALVIAHAPVGILGWVAAGISLAALLTVLGTGQADKLPIPAPRA